MDTIQQLKDRATAISTNTATGSNSSNIVGDLFYDIIKYTSDIFPFYIKNILKQNSETVLETGEIQTNPGILFSTMHLPIKGYDLLTGCWLHSIGFYNGVPSASTFISRSPVTGELPENTRYMLNAPPATTHIAINLANAQNIDLTNAAFRGDKIMLDRLGLIDFLSYNP